MPPEVALRWLTGRGRCAAVDRVRELIAGNPAYASS
jgi:hypothetical protein